MHRAQLHGGLDKIERSLVLADEGQGMREHGPDVGRTGKQLGRTLAGCQCLIVAALEQQDRALEALRRPLGGALLPFLLQHDAELALGLDDGGDRVLGPAEAHAQKRRPGKAPPGADIVRVLGQRLAVKVAGPLDVAPVDPDQVAHAVRRQQPGLQVLGVVEVLDAVPLGGAEIDVELGEDALGDRVLLLEGLGLRLIEAVLPDVDAPLRVEALDVDAYGVALDGERARDEIAHAELPGIGDALAGSEVATSVALAGCNHE